MILIKINKFSLGIFIDLNKAINTLLDHDIRQKNKINMVLKKKKLEIVSQIFNKQETIHQI